MKLSGVFKLFYRVTVTFMLVMVFTDNDTYFLKDGARRMDSRLRMHYNVVVFTPAMNR